MRSNVARLKARVQLQAHCVALVTIKPIPDQRSPS
jgi:hypothetical protein